MKHFFLATLTLLLFLSATAPSQAQTTNANAARYEYCELLKTDFLTTPRKTKGSDIFVDFGFGYEKLGESDFAKREVGKMEVLSTPLSTLNYMGKLGWELVQVYSLPNGQKNQQSTHMLLRRLTTASGPK
ncbi:hypothetical protein SAMN02745146_3536 [Hymenobacter daecheongensis DSM 21074]|uniref:DUF4177 domain-containing protein n=1 Tax=Hymenobacter daecheongensis DSM 21074 TaxID=1121955 RepID=A0A1M6KR98_9BACT|nr:hypothetical protein [Hymenobacter daecheongensis]SHJ61465.1 hypothetical protein SAMN02745146_3536 [Hymenobacter daecheongensis DSM 21074]